MADTQTNPATPPAPTAPQSGDGKDTFADLVNKKLRKIEGGRKDKFADLVNSKLAKIQQPAAQPAQSETVPGQHYLADQIQPHSDVSISSWEPTGWEKIKNIFKSGYVGRNFGFGEPFSKEAQRNYDSLTTEQKLKSIKEDEEKAKRWYNNPALAMTPLALIMPTDTEGSGGETGAVNLGALMTREERLAHPILRNMVGGPLDAVGGFTSPESAKQFLRWTVGGEIAAPVTGLALGWTGMATAKAGLPRLGQMIASPTTAKWLTQGVFMGPQVKDLAVGGYQAVAHSDESDPEHDPDAWGKILGNLVVLAGMHYGMKGLERGQKARNSADLDKATKEYSDRLKGNGDTEGAEMFRKPFKDLDPSRKALILYGEVGSADPSFRESVQSEFNKMKKAAAKKAGMKVGDLDKGIAGIRDQKVQDYREEERIRLEASDKVMNQIATAHARREIYKHEAAQRESAARQAAEEQQSAAQADTIVSAEEKRGFPVEVNREDPALLERRTTVKTTERESGQRYDPEHPEPAIPVTERRTAGEPTPEEKVKTTAAERAVQERTEAQFGQSFTSLPVDRQKLAAAWLEKNHPEQWEAFKGTPAYERHVSDVKHADMADAAVKQYLERNATGDGQPLAPGADAFSGAAKLILNRSNIDSVLKADPATAHDLNAHTERFLGKSFDSLSAEMRGPALADYLRTKPEKLQSFMTDDLTERMRTGQHIDIANMDAQGMMRQRASLRMDQRDSVRRAMDEDAATQMVTEERDRHHGELAAAITASESSRSPSLDEVNRVSKGLSEQASKMGLGQVNSPADLFKIEKDVLALPTRTRTPAVNEFLLRMRQVRAAAQDHVASELAEATAAKFRADAEEARPEAVEKVARLSIQSSELQQAADDLRAQGQAEAANAAQQTADFGRQKADAIVSGAQSVDHPSPPPQPKFAGKMSVGRPTRVVSDAQGVDLPAHYVLMEAMDVRTSHMPHSYEERPGYNQKGQPRKYLNSEHGRSRIEAIATKPDPDRFLNNGVEAVTGPPILEPTADVISGNRRAIGLIMSIRKSPNEFANYVKELYGKAMIFGIDPSEVAKYEHPVLVKVLDNPIMSDIERARLGTEFNRGIEGGMNDQEQGAAMARLLTPEFVDRLTNIVNSLDIFQKKGAITVREAMRVRSAEISQLLQDAGVIPKNKIEEYVDKDGELKDEAKNLIENMLASMTVTDSSVVKDASDSVRDKLTRAGLFFVQMHNAGEQWNLASYNTDAVRLLNMVQDAAGRLSHLIPRVAPEEGKADDSLVDRFIHPENYTDRKGFGPTGAFEFDGQPLVAQPNPAVEALAKALEESPRAYATMMANFADSASGTQGMLAIAAAEHPADVFTREIASKYGLNVIPEEWGAVAPMPDAVKIAIEAGREPLPVEPEEHHATVVADVMPDSSSVVDALPEGPKTVQELRKALETHPGITPELAASAITIFEDILPKALGLDLNTLIGNRKLAGDRAIRVIVGGEEFNEITQEGVTIRLYKSPDGKSREYHVPGKEPKGWEPERQRGAHWVEDGINIVKICDTGDVTTFIHEMTHVIRKYMKLEDQSIANKFVGFKPETPKNFTKLEDAQNFVNKNSGKDGQWEIAPNKNGFTTHKTWSVHQEEMFTGAHERYIYDGGLRRGKLEKVFATISRAMQQIYNDTKGRHLAKGTPELNAMFDKWYDWSRAERKPITLKTDIEALEEAGKADKVDIPPNAKLIEKGTYDKGMRPVSSDAKVFLMPDKGAADAFVKDRKNGLVSYEMHRVKGKETVYVRADTKVKKLYQPGLGETMELARKARDLEAQLKREQDPRRQALLRGQLNTIDDKLKGTMFVIGGKSEPKDTSVIQLVHGVSEMPRLDEPTTPAQAVTVQQVHGDPTGVALGGKDVRPSRVPDEAPGVRPTGATGEVHGGAGQADGKHEAGGGTGRGVPLVKPDKDPLAKVKAANLDAPERQRGTPVVDPEKWRGYVDELGLPKGTPPPTLRIDPDVRELLIFPGQPEVAEGVLSSLQQHDATVLASPAGSGKNYLLSAVAGHLLGASGDKIGLWVTRSQNLIHDAGNMKDVARIFGVDVNDLPSNVADMETGMYAATYAGISGNRDLLRVPWDFILFDESDSAAKWTTSDRGEATVLLAHAAKKVVYSSATPYGTVLEMGYMHKLGLWRKEGFARWAEQFGLVKTGPNEYAGGSAPRKLEKLRQQLIERGQWQQLHKDMEGTSAHVVLTPQTEEVRAGVRSIRKAFAQARSAFQRAKMAGLVKTAAGHEAIYLKRYLEAAKLPHAIEVGKKAIADGWAPVFFTEYRSPALEGMDFINRLPNDEGAAINAMLPPLPDIVAVLREEFGEKIGIFAGAANQLRAEELDAFQSGEKDALYATYAAGGVGASAHDLVGDRPRLGLFISLPWSSRMLEQASSRTDRYGRQSEVANLFLTTDALPEMKLMATKVLPRMAALKAAIFGVKNETQLSKNLREAVGLGQEAVEFDQGQEYAPDAADFEHTSNEAKFTHISDFELPDAAKAKNKPMKYKGGGKKLYQGPKDEDMDPFMRSAKAAWEDMAKQTRDLPAPVARAITANEGVIRLEAEEAGRAAMGTGESVENATNRKARDMANDIRLFIDNSDALYHGKKNVKAVARAAQEIGWAAFTSGYRVIEKVYRRAGMKEVGQEMRRRRTDYLLTKGGYQGRLQTLFHGIIDNNNLKPADIETMSKVVEGQTVSNDPRINKAAKEFQGLTASIRKTLGDAGCVVVYYEDGIRKEEPYSAIKNDPHYWPHIYDWDAEIKTTDKVTGKVERHTLSEIMNMPTSEERRERIIEQFADQHGISRSKAKAFFEKNDRGVRLAGNVERAREFDIPLYGRDRHAIERYIDQVSSTLAVTEVHGQFREKTDTLLDKLKPGDRAIVDHVITSDLDPVHLPETDRKVLGTASTIVIVGKMLWSPLKVMTHLWRATIDTNTRSLFFGLMRGATHPKELMERAMDCNALLDYTQSAYMREIGLKRESLGNKFLRFNGFNFEVQMSRIFLAATGRAFFERYAYPALLKDPNNTALRRNLRNQYGFSDEHLDNIIKNGYGPDDVRRMELGLANNIVGGGYASELPPIFRPDKNASPTMIHLNTLFRTTQMLHQYMIKTANQVGDRVFDEMKEEGFKSSDTYRQLLRFAFNAGLAGFALNQLIYMRHKMVGSPEAEIEKRRNEWLAEHPASSEALWWAMANYTMAIGLQGPSSLFQSMATHNAKDHAKLAGRHGLTKDVAAQVMGIPGQDMEAFSTATEDMVNTSADTGKHKLSVEDRRKNIVKRLLAEEVVGINLLPGMAPKKVEPSHHARRHKATSRF